MLKLTSITSAALLSLCSVTFAQQASEPLMMREHAVDGTTAVTVARGAAGAQGRAFAASGLTRAEVQAEMAGARGDVAAWRELGGDGTAAVTMPRAAAGAQGRAFSAPGLTRAEVQAELARARASGEIERYNALYVGGGN